MLLCLVGGCWGEQYFDKVFRLGEISESCTSNIYSAVNWFQLRSSFSFCFGLSLSSHREEDVKDMEGLIHQTNPYLSEPTKRPAGQFI